jgi:hypothetical protein
MNCPESLELLQQRLDGAPFGANPALEQHLAECATCRERHGAARRLLDVLKGTPRAVAAPGLAARVVKTALRDRQRRQRRVRRSLYVTAGLAAAILLMLLAGYLDRRAGNDSPVGPGPAVGPVAKAADKDVTKDAPPPSIATLSGKLADKTLDQAKVLWTAANPVEGMPVAELPNVADPGPAAEPIRQAKQEVSEGLQAVSRSARRAFDYFSPMLDLPQGH